jgi:GGDEF domain-containing protein
MNRKFATAFSILCLGAALVAAGSVAYRVLSAEAAGREAAKLDFEGLRSVLAYVKSPSDLADPGLRARLAARYEANPGLLFVDVYERESGDRWRIPAASPYLPVGHAQGAAPEPVEPPTSTMLLSAPLKGDSTGKLAVDALYANIFQIEAFEPFRDSLIGLGAFLALAAVALAIASSSRVAFGAEAEAGEGDQSVSLGAAAAHYQYRTMLDEEGAEEFDIPVIDSGLAVKSEPEVAAGFTSANPAEKKAADEPEAAGPLPSPVIPKPKEAAAMTEKRPSGLYSPASGLGWEQYMQERLNAEISRSASFEQDLSLLILSYDGLSSQDKQYASIGEAIKEFFSFRDLAFERGDDGFSIILPNIDSSHAIRMAEEFFKKLGFLAEGDLAELELLPLFMGISSRAGRLVDASRLADEAASALERARYEKDSRIVAFRPDPDKYRRFLASKGA